jgi:hypothetical protein
VANKKTALKRAKKEAARRAALLQGPFVRPTEVPEFKPLVCDDLPPTGTDGSSEND